MVNTEVWYLDERRGVYSKFPKALEVIHPILVG
jgi:hypothetical protein